MIRYVFTDLPKLSLNEWYGSKHWTKRSAMKDIYRAIVTPRIKPIDYPVNVAYLFEFQARPLDQSNCVAMVKLIEDCIFPDDSPKIVKDLYIKGFKSPRAKELKQKKIEVVITVIIKPYVEQQV